MIPCLVLPRDCRVASPHQDLSLWKIKRHQASSTFYPLQKAAPCWKSKLGRTTEAGEAKPGRSTKHWVQIPTSITFSANLAHSHTAHSPCLSCSERKTVLMNCLINHSSFLFSISPLGNMVKTLPTVWKCLAWRGWELLVLLGTCEFVVGGLY